MNHLQKKTLHTVISNINTVNEGITMRKTVILYQDRIQDIIDPNDEKDYLNHHHIKHYLCYSSDGLLLPGVIDTHVHFRQPGYAYKAGWKSESHAAAAGGVTTVFDMPNTKPLTDSLLHWKQKMQLAEKNSIVNYAAFYGATNTNTDTFSKIDRSLTPGVKLFMGSSTGNMLVNSNDALSAIFRKAHLPIVAHCEDPEVIAHNSHHVLEQYGKDADVSLHSLIRDEESCLRSTKQAISLALKNHARLHVAHVSTARELDLIAQAGSLVTAEVCLPHLLFCNEDYAQLGARIKCNPAVKTRADHDALLQALSDDRIYTIATDHAPHLLREKQGGCFQAVSGMPMVQFSLPAMLTLADEGVISIPQLVRLMCHHPAQLFNVRNRGFIRKGYKADLVIVEPEKNMVLKKDILSKCKWSPMEGRELGWKVRNTFVNGVCIYSNEAEGKRFLNEELHSEPVGFYKTRPFAPSHA